MYDQSMYVHKNQSTNDDRCDKRVSPKSSWSTTAPRRLQQSKRSTRICCYGWQSRCSVVQLRSGRKLRVSRRRSSGEWIRRHSTGRRSHRVTGTSSVYRTGQSNYSRTSAPYYGNWSIEWTSPASNTNYPRRTNITVTDENNTGSNFADI